MPRSVFRITTLWCGAWLVALAQTQCVRADETPTTRHAIRRSGADSAASGKSANSSIGFWLSSGGVAAALALFGVYSLTVKKVRPNSESPALRVIARTSLSSRQAVYLVRVGDRTLILGTGGQGAPSLLGELTETTAPESSFKATSSVGRTRIGAGV